MLEGIITLTTENYRIRNYYDIRETKFKSQYTNNCKSFKKKYQTDAKLFNEMWKLKEQTKNVDILWEILGIHQSHNTATKQYMLRLNKKLTIVLQKTRQHFKQTYQDYKQM